MAFAKPALIAFTPANAPDISNSIEIQLQTPINYGTLSGSVMPSIEGLLAMAGLKAPPAAFCAECGNPFYRTQPNKIYCGGTCRQRQWNRRVNCGFKLYELAMRWRIERPKGAISDLQHVVDDMAGEERIIRDRRARTIAAHQADGVIGDLPPVFEPGENRSQSVSLSPPQQYAIADAGIFALAFAGGRVPNDPDRRPDGWSLEKLEEIRNAVITLGGSEGLSVLAQS